MDGGRWSTPKSRLFVNPHTETLNDSHSSYKYIHLVKYVFNVKILLQSQHLVFIRMRETFSK